MKLKFLALIIFITVNSLLIEKFIANQYHIPALKIPEAMIVKKMQKMALMGSDTFYLSRSSLSNNRLNLSHWYGHQEIRFENNKKIRQIRYRLNLSNDSDVFIYWNHHDSGVDGLRIENNKKITIRRQINDEVESIRLAKMDSIPKSVDLVLNQAEADITIDINDNKYIVKNEFLEGAWGIRGDSTGVEVEKIRVTFVDSSEYYQDFSSEFIPKNFVVSFLVLTLIGCLVKFIPFKFILYFMYLFFVFLMTLYFVDLKLMSIRQIEALTGRVGPKKESYFWDNLEEFRTKLFYPNTILDEIRRFTNSKYPDMRIVGGPIVCIKKGLCRYYPNLGLANISNKKNGIKRFMFVGTSQTIGAGASELKHTFFSLLHKRINKNEDSVSINISQSALSPEEMLERFIAAIAVYRPTHVVVNLGYNQASYSLKKVLADFYELTKKIDARIIFVREANKLVEESEYLREVDHFTKENSLPTIDLYGYLRSPLVNEDISIWWDPVHLNDRGQRLAADFIYEEFLRLKFL